MKQVLVILLALVVLVGCGKETKEEAAKIKAAADAKAAAEKKAAETAKSHAVKNTGSER